MMCCFNKKVLTHWGMDSTRPLKVSSCFESVLWFSNPPLFFFCKCIVLLEYDAGFFLNEKSLYECFFFLSFICLCLEKMILQNH